VRERPAFLGSFLKRHADDYELVCPEPGRGLLVFKVNFSRREVSSHAGVKEAHLFSSWGTLVSAATHGSAENRRFPGPPGPCADRGIPLNGSSFSRCSKIMQVRIVDPVFSFPSAVLGRLQADLLRFFPGFRSLPCRNTWAPAPAGVWRGHQFEGLRLFPCFPPQRQ